MNEKSVAIQAINNLRAMAEELDTDLACDEWTVSREVTDRTGEWILQVREALAGALNAIYNAEETHGNL